MRQLLHRDTDPLFDDEIFVGGIAHKIKKYK